MPRFIRLITMPGEFFIHDVTGPLRVKSVNGNNFGLILLDHRTNTSFAYVMNSKDEYPK